MSASDAKYSERENRTAPQSKIISILHSHNKTIVRSTGVRGSYSNNNATMDKLGQSNSTLAMSTSILGTTSQRADGLDQALKGGTGNNTNNGSERTLSLSQLGAEIEQSVQTLEQEMKISQNQLNYLEVFKSIWCCWFEKRLF